jgi:hypothetical protein
MLRSVAKQRVSKHGAAFAFDTALAVEDGIDPRRVTPLLRLRAYRYRDSNSTE